MVREWSIDGLMMVHKGLYTWSKNGFIMVS